MLVSRRQNRSQSELLQIFLTRVGDGTLDRRDHVVVHKAHKLQGSAGRWWQGKLRWQVDAILAVFKVVWCVAIPDGEDEIAEILIQSGTDLTVNAYARINPVIQTLLRVTQLCTISARSPISTIGSV